MYVISSPLPFRVSRKQEQESAKGLWVTHDWLENTAEVALGSWTFDPMFPMCPTATSAVLPRDRTPIHAALSCPVCGERQEVLTHLVETLDPDPASCH